MSVPKSKRSKPKLKFMLDVNTMMRHTLIVTSNENNFPSKYKTLTEDIVHTAESVFVNCWTANNIRVTDINTAKDRHRYQQKALYDCNNLLALINLAYGICHLRGKKVDYWSTLIINAHDEIYRWSVSDSKRYGLT